MKSLILTALFVLSSVFTFGQVITVISLKIDVYASNGSVDPFYAIANKGWDTTEFVSGKYVIDLKKRTSTYFKENVLVSTVNITQVIKKGDTYYITLLDTNVNNSTDKFNTHMIVNVSDNLFVFYWYDDILDFTKVEFSSDLSVTSKF